MGDIYTPNTLGVAIELRYFEIIPEKMAIFVLLFCPFWYLKRDIK